MDYSKLASAEQISRAMSVLEVNGIKAYLVENAQEAKQKTLEIIPQGVEIMTMTSMTLDTIGLTQELNESNNYISVRKQKFPTATDSEKRKLGGGPDWTIGSVHALTEDGKLIIASNTGSQLGAYAYGAGNVVWVVGAQKIVKDLDMGMKRVYDYVLPLESERAHKAYGVPGSFVSKVLIVNREVTPDRIHVIIVNEQLGF